MPNTFTKARKSYINFEKRYYVSASNAYEFHENGSDYFDGRARWDDSTALSGSDLPVSNREKAIFYIVPIECKLLGFSGISSTFSSGAEHTVSLWHGTPELNAAVDTTMTLACTVTSSNNTRFEFEDMSATCDISLSKGDCLLFTVRRSTGITTRTYVGSLTCLMEV